MPVKSDAAEADNWKQLNFVRRFLGRELTTAERDEVLRVGLNAEFFRRAYEERQHAHSRSTQ